MRACPNYLPTPSQIAEACASIRAGWSISERQRRVVDPKLRSERPCWLPPRVDTSECSSRVRKMLGDPVA